MYYYAPIRTRSNCPLSFVHDAETKPLVRASSEIRDPISLFPLTSSSAPPGYRTFRSVSVIPESIGYKEQSRFITNPSLSRTVDALRRPSSLEPSISSLPARLSYNESIVPDTVHYAPRTWNRPLTDAYLRSRYLPPVSEASLFRTLTPRDSAYLSSRPYESYTYVSPFYRRSFSTYYPDDTYYVYKKPSNYSNSDDSYSTYPSGYVPSVLKYPSFNRNSYLTRVVV